MSTYSDKLKDPRWQKKRLEILERDNWTCQWCQDTQNTLHVHHMKYNGDPWDADSDHLITLCYSCHESIDSGFNEAGQKLINAFKSKAFAAEHLLKLAKAVESGQLRGLPYEPTTDIISFLFSDIDSFHLLSIRFNNG
jgi:hypothetical protein